MNIEDYREFCLSLGEGTASGRCLHKVGNLSTDSEAENEKVKEKLPFTAFHYASEVLVFYVCGHMFAFFDCNNFSVVTLKCQSDRIEELKEHYSCIGKPFNESPKYWIGIDPATAPDNLLKELTRNSYEIVKAKYHKQSKNKKKMKKKTILMMAAAIMTVMPCRAQIRNFTWQNTQRQYLLFEPSGRDGALPVMYFLHGLGDNITRCNNEMHFDQLAERYGWVIVVPQALSVQGYTMWNAGLGGSADDAGFLLALLDTLVADGKVNDDSVFFTGFSMGGFMTHRMAIEHGDRITACAPVSGLIAFAFADDVPVEPVRMMHIHGTADDVVGWNGGSAYFGTIGISVDSLVNYWTDWNVCDPTPAIDTLPNRVNDGLRFIRYTYSGDAEFQLLKVIGGTHDWYQDTNAHDIDYFDEIHRFFLGDGSSLGLNDPTDGTPVFEVWPNPAAGYLYVRLSEPTTLTLYDSNGMPVIKKAFDSGVSRMDLHHAPNGIYVIADGKGASRKIITHQ